MPHAVPSVLLVDDDDVTLERLATALASRGFATLRAQSASKALEILKENHCLLIVSDIKMPEQDGFDLTQKIRELRPEAAVILMTAHSSIDSAIEAIRAGAFDYITKPVDANELSLVLKRALERAQLIDENRSLRLALESENNLANLHAKSKAMKQVLTLAKKVAGANSSILITGESGTGKDVLARTIHFNGPRAKKPFVPINCTAIPAELLESELFGHVRGAFTGADTAKRGLFEEADEGTLFLDEIGDMSAALQAKLLRVLQDGKVRRVGSNESRSIDVRILAATNQNLKEAIAEKRFREDLFYRLNVIPIHLPPLRERREDIPFLVSHFLKKHSPKRSRTVSTAAMQMLMQCNWPGNIRELENTIERALAISDASVLEPEDFLLEVLSTAAEETAVATGEVSLIREAAERNLSLKEVTNLYIDEILRRTSGNKQQAAQILGVNRTTLYRREESGETLPGKGSENDPSCSQY